MKRFKKRFRIQDLILLLVTVITVPLLYQNCGDVDFQRFQSAVPDAGTGIGVEVRNGAGTVVANGGSLCAGGADATQSRIAIISIATSLSANTYYCRRVRPTSDDSFWNCQEARSFGSSTGSFGIIPGSDDTHAALGYSNLSNGTYDIEVSAEGSTWTTPAIPVSFVVEDCSGATPPPVGSATCSDTNVSQAGNQQFSCGSWIYNTSAVNSTNPSYSVCCSCRSDETGSPPNCSCPSGQEEYRGRCVNECSAGQVRNSSGVCETVVNPVATCSDTNLSQAGSQVFNCDSSSIYNTSADNRQNPSYQVCCQCRSGQIGTPPNCGCPSGQVKVGQSCVAPTCSDTNPSQSGSQQYNCGNWTYNTSSNGMTNPSQSRCCITPPATCLDTDPSQSGNQQYNCGSWTYKASANALGNPSYSVCCRCRSDQTGTPPNSCLCPSGKEEYKGACVDQCASGQVRNSSGVCETVVNPVATCGDTNLSQAGDQQFNCGSNSIYNSSANNRQSPSHAVCCQCRSGQVGTPPNCSCPSGQVKVGQSCVSPTCGDTKPAESGNQRYNCGSWTYNTSSGNLTSPSRSRCCTEPEATCADTDPSQSGNQQYNCGSWTYNTSANNFTSPSQSRCCTAPPATCADIDPSTSGSQKFDCGNWTYKTSADSSTNPSYQVCCQCPSGRVGTPPNCSCPSGKELFNGSCVNVCPSGQTRNPSTGVCEAPPSCEETNPPTCRDTDCETSGNQPYSCTSGVYNTSAGSRTNPSDEVCCQCPSGRVGTPPNCRCPSGQEEYNGRCVSVCTGGKTRNAQGQCVCPSNKEECNGSCYNACGANETRNTTTCQCGPDDPPPPPGCHQDQCEVNGKCVAKPTCSGFSCDSGYELKSPLPTLTCDNSADRDTCCDKVVPPCPCNKGHLYCTGTTYKSTGLSCKTKTCPGSKQGTCDPSIAATKCTNETFANSCQDANACRGTKTDGRCSPKTCAQVNYDCSQHGKRPKGSTQWNNNSPATEANCCRPTTTTTSSTTTTTTTLPDCERVEACKNWVAGTICKGRGLDTFEAGGDFVCYTECEWTLTRDDPETQYVCGSFSSPGNGWRCPGSTHGFPDVLELCSGDGGNNQPCTCSGARSICRGVRFRDSCGNLACTGSKRCSTTTTRRSTTTTQRPTTTTQSGGGGFGGGPPPGAY